MRATSRWLKTTWRIVLLSLAVRAPTGLAQTWSADNGNGTYSNPLFYEEFSDPDLIRVGSDFYLTGTTMHSMPGLPILHSTDLVNWTLLGYASDRLDLGPAFRLEDGLQIYGRGIWAPSFRYHDGTFYIFSNVNGQTTQLFRSKNPHGPWTRTAMKRSFHDLSVLFDDDGSVFVVWGYRDIHLARLNADLTDIVDGSERVIIDKDAGMGEGSHFYKIRGKYYITSAWYAGRMRMPAARADKPEGPYEVNQEISADEDFGLMQGYRLRSTTAPPFDVSPPDTGSHGHISMHQGGMVETPAGEWWGFSMMDYNSIGRLTALSPITWKDGWPYFGLPGNLGRSPRIWVKPTAPVSQRSAPYSRNDDFSAPSLNPVWQWNHVPVDSEWSLTERRGFLRLHSLPANDLWHARNTLTQRAIGPQSEPVALLDARDMQSGDVAGLALFNFPYAWIGVRRTSAGLAIEQFDQTTNRSTTVPFRTGRVWVRANCDFLTEKARFSYSLDGRHFTPLGGEFTMVFQLKTFQGVRFALFHFNTSGSTGGVADFDEFRVRETHPRALTRPIPYGSTIAFSTFGGRGTVEVRDSLLVAGDADQSAAAHFQIVDRGLGRVALHTAAGFVSVDTAARVRIAVRRGGAGPAETFQWIETPYGDLALMSLVTHRYLRFDATTGMAVADQRGPTSNRADGSVVVWRIVR